MCLAQGGKVQLRASGCFDGKERSIFHDEDEKIYTSRAELIFLIQNFCMLGMYMSVMNFVEHYVCNDCYSFLHRRRIHFNHNHNTVCLIIAVLNLCFFFVVVENITHSALITPFHQSTVFSFITYEIELLVRGKPMSSANHHSSILTITPLKEIIPFPVYNPTGILKRVVELFLFHL